MSVDYSHLPIPTIFVPPTDNPMILPRTDKGETEERLAFFITIQQNSKESDDFDDKRLSRAKKIAFKSKDIERSKSKDREKKKKANIIANITKVRRNSDAKRSPVVNLAKKDNRLVKSTQNLDLSSLTESINTQAEFEEKLKTQEIIVEKVKRDIESCNDPSDKEALKEKLMEQVTLLTQIRMHVNIMKDFHIRGYLEMRIIDPNFSKEAPFTRYWFYLNYPRLCCYDNEHVCIK